MTGGRFEIDMPEVGVRQAVANLRAEASAAEVTTPAAPPEVAA